MSYIGVQPTAGQYRKLDDISASFNGSTTSFTTSVGGTNVTAGTAQQLLVSVGGVIQEPDADYTVSTNTITFTTAPASGLDFFAILMGDALNTVTTSDGSITTAKLAGSLSVGLAAGTNSAPSLYFTGDSNTGVYSPGADQVAVTTGGTARLTIDSSGNVNIDSNTLYVDAANNRVGLGTSSPAQALDVRTATGNAYINVGRNSQSAGQVAVSLGGGTSGTDWILYQPTSSNDFRIFGNSGDRVTVTSGGNVGIGTTNPGAQNTATALVVGNTSQNNGITILTGTNNDGVLNFNDGENTNLRGYLIYEHSTDSLRFGANGSERGRFDSSGRLLVGTSSSTGSARAVFQGNSFSSGQPGIILIQRDTSSSGLTAGAAMGYIIFGDNVGSNYAVIGCEADGATGTNDYPSRLVFSTTADGASSPTEAARINSSGNLLIGVTSSAADCRTHIYKTVSSGDVLRVQNASGNTGVAYIGFRYGTGNGTETGYISTNGTSTTYNTSSDYRLKENITPLTGAIDRVSQLQVHRFNFIADPDRIVDGFIAHEAQAVVPECVTGEKDAVDEDGNPKYQGIDQSKLVPLLTAALQEALAEIESLKARVTALEP